MKARLEADSLVHVGDPSPSFSLTDVEGHEFATDDLRGKVVLVNFFATWCGPCMVELPILQKMWDDHGDNPNFTMLIVGREETDESVAAFRSKHGYTFPMAADPAQTVYALYAKKTIPRTYLVSADGRICFSAAGYSEDDLANLRKELAVQLKSR